MGLEIGFDLLRIQPRSSASRAGGEAAPASETFVVFAADLRQCGAGRGSRDANSRQINAERPAGGNNQAVLGEPSRLNDMRRGALVAYGFMTLPLAIAGLPLAIFIPPFYTQELGLDLTTVGMVLMAARISDVLTDPVIGALSDRFPTRWGRRRPWIVAGTPVMMLGSCREPASVPAIC